MIISQALELKELEVKTMSTVDYWEKKIEWIKKDAKEDKLTPQFVFQDLYVEAVKNYEVAQAELKTIKKIKELLKI